MSSAAAGITRFEKFISGYNPGEKQRLFSVIKTMYMFYLNSSTFGGRKLELGAISVNLPVS